MCKIIHFKDLECKHRWARVVRPCTHGTGFSDCPSFTDPNYVRGTPRAYIARQAGSNLFDEMELSTRDTSHVPYTRVYEPSEDSFLLLDTLSSPSETSFLTSRLASPASPSPLVVEIGPGSGVVLAFVTAHAKSLLGTSSILSLGIDANRFACAATTLTTAKAISSSSSSSEPGFGFYLDTLQGDLTTPLRLNQVDVLIFNPPYVPTPSLPSLLLPGEKNISRFEQDSHLLELSYAGGKDGMETTDRLLSQLPGILSPRGCAYLLLCAQNFPDKVKAEIVERFGGDDGWRAETVGTSGRQAGWEKLQIVRIWRDYV
ncbi:hypothetical protein QBC47DRAFT_458378 [Echria macrotheca]|uniref:Uncharacterized protein n=1 Tax=Echria macrotheca TaxID=438768 RepID=A0AAJ0BH70_9PEZI|nr:hypothetical protein QBC47DRAFT_458378 [Echria macrotheca]